jgi:hypothetical protein
VKYSLFAGFEVDVPSAAVRRSPCMSVLWIILVIILVLALLGLFSRGYW